HRLMMKNMSPEQISAMAEIEAHRTRQVELGISRPRLEPVREEQREQDTGKVKEGDAVKFSEGDTETTRREAELDDEDVAAVAAVAADAMNEVLGTALTEAARAVSVETEDEDAEIEEIDAEHQ